MIEEGTYIQEELCLKQQVLATQHLRPNGFPTTLGAFQRTFQGGDTDMGIMKFDSSGTFLQYSTIIGGSDAEIPTSTVVNENNELYILGTTSSPDFPCDLWSI